MTEKSVTVAYQGEAGAFSESAARRMLGSSVETKPFRSFDDMFAAVASSEADCCIAPIENSLAGSVHANYDLLGTYQLTIAGETYLRIVHCLIAPPGVTLATIRRVYSHPVALAQCERFLRSIPEMEPTVAHDTAGSVRLVMSHGRDDEAAIASSAAAAIYGADILVEGVEDNPRNFTRFLLLTRDRESIPPTEGESRRKTSIVFRTANKPGALFRALGAFAMRDIDLTKMESRPVEGRPWEYSFYVDFIGGVDDLAVRRALANLEEVSEEVRVLGSYPTRW